MGLTVNEILAKQGENKNKSTDTRLMELSEANLGGALIGGIVGGVFSYTRKYNLLFGIFVGAILGSIVVKQFIKKK